MIGLRVVILAGLLPFASRPLLDASRGEFGLTSTVVLTIVVGLAAWIAWGLWGRYGKTA